MFWNWIGQFILVLVGSFIGSYLSYKVKLDRLSFEKQQYQEEKQEKARLDDLVENAEVEPLRK